MTTPTLDSSSVLTEWGGASAEAYADFTWVNSYIECNKFESDDWTSATTTQKVAAILQATRDIDAKMYWGGKWYSYQKLKFPMAREPTPQGFTYNTSLYPELEWMQRDVKSACAEQALWISRNLGRDLHSERQLQGIRSVSEGIGKLSESYSYSGAPTVLCPEAVILLRKYFGSIRLERG